MYMYKEILTILRSADYNYSGVFVGYNGMKVDLTRLKLQPGRKEEFHFVRPGKDDFLSEAGGRFLEPLDVRVVIENTGHLFSGRGEVKTLLALNCGRCLEPFNYRIHCDLELLLAESPDGLDIDPDDVIRIHDDQADILSRVEEVIFSQIPLNPLCNPNCRGLCSECGANKNLTDCSCQPEDIDPRWAQLKKLSFE